MKISIKYTVNVEQIICCKMAIKWLTVSRDTPLKHTHTHLQLLSWSRAAACRLCKYQRERPSQGLLSVYRNCDEFTPNKITRDRIKAAHGLVCMLLPTADRVQQTKDRSSTFREKWEDWLKYAWRFNIRIKFITTEDLSVAHRSVTSLFRRVHTIKHLNFTSDFELHHACEIIHNIW